MHERGFFQDIRHTLRTLRTRPLFAATVVTMLGLGIGATTAIFSVVNGVIIKPLPYPDSATLVRIVHSIGGIEQPYFSDAVYLTYLDHTQAFQDVGVWSPGESAAITGQGDPEEVRALKASRGVLTTLGVRPEIGRWFSAAEDAAGAPGTVILTNGYWQRRFGRDRGVLRRALTINGRPHQIIGVMPAAFRFDSERAFELVLPLQIDRSAPRAGFGLLGVARLKPGVTLSQANADAGRVLSLWFENARTRPEVRARWAPALRSLKDDIVGNAGSTLWTLLVAIGIVLLMACSNVANLLLVRADSRRQELAIRATLGAKWTRLAQQLLLESLTLAVIGGVLGVCLAFVGLRALVATGPANLPRLSEASIDPLVLCLAATMTLVAGVLFGLIPIVKSVRPRLADLLAAGRGVGIARERQRSQQALVAAQLALALVLLVSAVLMIRSFQSLRSVDAGFTEPGHVQTFSVTIPLSAVPEAARVTRMQQEILNRIAAFPGVASAAFTTRLPMGSDRASTALLVEGTENAGPATPGGSPPNRQVKIISPGVFRTLGTPLVAGRDFTWTDLYDLRDVAIVSENLARELFGSPADALGRRIREFYNKKSPWQEIVGVVGDVHDDGANRPAPATVYWPAQPDEYLLSMTTGYQARRVSVAIRTERAGTQALLNEVRRAVRSVSATLPVAQERTLDAVYDQSLARTAFTLVLLAIAGAMALLLGIAGIVGVISYAVSQRRREIGIRLALGARAEQIRSLFLRRGVVLACVGITVGLVAAAFTTQLMQSLLFGVAPLDPLTFTVTPVVLAALTLFAAYVPARRALSVDPAETMRTE